MPLAPRLDARRTLLVYVTNIVGGLFGLVTLYFIGRYMDPVAYGMFGFAMGFLGFLAILGDLGLGTSHVRHVSVGHDMDACVRTFIALKYAALAAFVFASALGLLVWAASPYFRDASRLPVMLLVGVMLILTMIRSIPVNTLTALRQTAKTQFIVLLEHVVKLPLVIIAAFLYGSMGDERFPLSSTLRSLGEHLGITTPPRPEHGAVLLALAFLAAVAASGAYALRAMPPSFAVRPRLEPALVRSYLVFAFPALVVVTLRIVFTQVDAVLVGYFLVAENVGYFFAADRLTSLILLVPTAIQLTFFPILTELAKRDGPPAVDVVARSIQRTLSLVMVLITLFFFLYPAEVIKIFLGDPFLPAARVVRIMAIYVALLAFASTSSHILMAMGRPRIVLQAGAVALLLNIILDIILIPDTLFGRPAGGLHSVGAATASVIAQAVGLLVLVVAGRRETGRSQIGKPTLKHVAAAVLTGLILHAIDGPLFFQAQVRVWELGYAVATGTVLYFTFLFLFREVSRHDAVLFGRIADPKAMMAYVRTEFQEKR